MVLRVTLCTGLLLATSLSLAAEQAPSLTAGPAAQAPVLITAPGQNPDPWEKYNRGVYRFNDVVDRYTLKPVAKGYRAVTPNVVRTGITNFFINLRSPLVIMNDLLQGKVRQAGSDTARFVVNSTVGIVGLIDVGARINLPLHDEDFGQTLGVWGVPAGPYLMLPFMGPSSVRDGAGFGVDAVANPRRRLISREADWILFGMDLVNSRASLLELEDIIQGDSYLFIRDLYLQRREYAVRDGRVENDPFLDDSFEDEDEDSAAPAGDALPEAVPEDAARRPEPVPARPDQASPEAGARVPTAPATEGSVAVDAGDGSGN
jgi:phospholipid-binding lipoprotein MlaA